MKLLIVLCLVAVVAAAPAVYEVRLVSYENNNVGFGPYGYSYETSDGTKAQQSGQLKNEGTKEESLAVTGRYEWTAPNGIHYIVTYTADEEGYKPEISEGPGLDPNAVASILG